MISRGIWRCGVRRTRRVRRHRALETAVRRLIEITSRQQQTQRTLLDWLRVEYAIEEPSNKLLAATDLDSDTWVGEVKRIRGKKQPLTAAGLQGLRDEYIRTLEPARALAAETLTLERTLSDLVNQAYALTPAEIALMWKTAPPRLRCRADRLLAVPPTDRPGHV